MKEVEGIVLITTGVLNYYNSEWEYSYCCHHQPDTFLSKTLTSQSKKVALTTNLPWKPTITQTIIDVIIPLLPHLFEL